MKLHFLPLVALLSTPFHLHAMEEEDLLVQNRKPSGQILLVPKEEQKLTSIKDIAHIINNQTDSTFTTVLNIKECGLESLYDIHLVQAKIAPSHITSITVSRNNLDAKDLGYLLKYLGLVTTINFSYNNIDNVDTIIPHHHLADLDLSHNKLNGTFPLQKILSAFSSIQKLTIAHNQVENIEPCNNKYKQLQYFYAHNNKFTCVNIGNFIDYCSNLKEVTFNNNPITTVISTSKKADTVYFGFGPKNQCTFDFRNTHLSGQEKKEIVKNSYYRRSAQAENVALRCLYPIIPVALFGYIFMELLFGIGGGGYLWSGCKSISEVLNFHPCQYKYRTQVVIPTCCALYLILTCAFIGIQHQFSPFYKVQWDSDEEYNDNNTTELQQITEQ